MDISKTLIGKGSGNFELVNHELTQNLPGSVLTFKVTGSTSAETQLCLFGGNEVARISEGNTTCTISSSTLRYDTAAGDYTAKLERITKNISLAAPFVMTEFKIVQLTNTGSIYDGFFDIVKGPLTGSPRVLPQDINNAINPETNQSNIYVFNYSNGVVVDGETLLKLRIPQETVATQLTVSIKVAMMKNVSMARAV